MKILESNQFWKRLTTVLLLTAQHEPGGCAASVAGLGLSVGVAPRPCWGAPAAPPASVFLQPVSCGCCSPHLLGVASCRVLLRTPCCVVSVSLRSLPVLLRSLFAIAVILPCWYFEFILCCCFLWTVRHPQPVRSLMVSCCRWSVGLSPVCVKLSVMLWPSEWTMRIQLHSFVVPHMTHPNMWSCKCDVVK